ncbi:matrixin family metalloprotease, partial [Arsukibacterium sp.]|uniref:matrixin family metalloprotease n=1 Tax=Arsukibacterium sp. TaxID=1977258 RepID=UPI00299D7067
ALFAAQQPASAILKQVAGKAMRQQLCQTPVLWRIGELDPAFALTAEQAEQAGHQAATAWNNAAGTALFRYDSVNGFPINFHYDQRQQQMLQQAMLQRNIARYDSNIELRAAELAQQSKQLQQRQREFAEQNQQFAADIATFNQQAASASQADLAALEQQQRRLQHREQQLQQQAAELNEQQERLQRQQFYLNDTVADRNALLTEQPAPGVAEVGLMEINNNKRRMTIFAYSTPATLQMTIAHEFGHALGLGHIDNINALMHPALNPLQTGPTADDIAALKQQCGF